MPRPLEGKSFLVTRPKHQARDLADPLEALGAKVWVLPAIDIAPPLDWAPLDAALNGLDEFDWVVLTSANGVEAVRARMAALGISPDRLATRRLAVIGPATAEALTAAFRGPDAIPDEFVSEAISEALGEVRGLRILLARADIARRDLATILSERGATVVGVAAYRIVPPTDEAIVLPDRAPDAITLTSSAAVRGTLAALQSRNREAWMEQAALICIGPITAQTVRELGYLPAAMANEYTIPGLVAALRSYFESSMTEVARV